MEKTKKRVTESLELSFTPRPCRQGPKARRKEGDGRDVDTQRDEGRRLDSGPGLSARTRATLGRQVNPAECPSPHPQSENAALYVFGF